MHRRSAEGGGKVNRWYVRAGNEAGKKEVMPAHESVRLEYVLSVQRALPKLKELAVSAPAR